MPCKYVATGFAVTLSRKSLTYFMDDFRSIKFYMRWYGNYLKIINAKKWGVDKNYIIYYDVKILNHFSKEKTFYVGILC